MMRDHAPAARVAQASDAARSRSPHRTRSDLALLVAAVTSAAMVGAALLFLVGVRVEQQREGYRVHDLRTAIVRLRNERAQLEAENANLTRPARLAFVAREQLSLVPAEPERTVTLMQLKGALPPIATAAPVAATHAPSRGATAHHGGTR